MRPLLILYGKQQIISYRIHYIIGKINVLQISLIQYQQAVSHHLHQFCGLLLWIDVVIPVRISRKLCKRQTMRLTLKYTPLVYERRGFLHSSGRLSDHGIK